jgi:multidrug resistance efflux pump
MAKLKKLSPYLACAFLLFTLAGFGARHKVDGKQRPMAGADADVTRVARGFGYIEPVTEVRRLCFKSEGVVDSVQVAVGQHVKQGDTLMQLDCAELLAQKELAQRQVDLAHAKRDLINSGSDKHDVESARALLDIEKEKLTRATQECKRYQRLFCEGACTAQQLEHVESECRQAAASVSNREAAVQHLKNIVKGEERRLADVDAEFAEAQLHLVDVQIDERNLKAPFDGEVLEILRREGESTSLRDEPVLLFGNTSALQVRAEIDERFAHLLRPGLPAQITLRSDDSICFNVSIREVRGIMGRKTVFANSIQERKDTDVLTVIADIQTDRRLPVGLEVDLTIQM